MSVLLKLPVFAGFATGGVEPDAAFEYLAGPVFEVLEITAFGGALSFAIPGETDILAGLLAGGLTTVGFESASLAVDGPPAPREAFLGLEVAALAVEEAGPLMSLA